MNIRNRLLISYLTVTLMLCAGFFVITHYFVIEEMTERHLESAQRGVGKIAEKNYELSKEVLTEYGKKYVQMRADIATLQIKNELRNYDRPYNYDVLRDDEELRAVATQSVEANGRMVGYVDVLDRHGVAVLHPNKEVEGENFKKWGDKFPKMWGYVKKSFTEPHVAGYYTFFDSDNRQPRKKYMVLQQIPDTDFVLAATVYINDYFLPVHRQIQKAEKQAVNGVESEMKSASQSTIWRARVVALATLSILTIVGVVLGLWFAGSIADPISDLEKAVQSIGEGNFETHVEEKGPSEIAGLARSFNELGGSLNDYVEKLKKETAARKVVENEIRIAHRIQQSLIPHSFPPFPDRDEFQLHAVLQPAKEVAGDYYDFFFTDDDTLAVIVGDVSGKSIPAAFFMAMTRTLMRNECMREGNPADVLQSVNEVLCQDNEECMFVTLFLAYYNVRTGEMVYSNAGHHAACKLNLNGDLEEFGLTNDVILGVLPGSEFHTGKHVLKEGEEFVLYTDGVTDARAPDGEMFGEERFKSLLQQNAGKKPEEQCENTVEVLRDYQRGQPFDDVTLVIMRRI